jgi:hypothetical protein
VTLSPPGRAHTKEVHVLHDLAAVATTQFLADIEQARQRWVADQLARLAPDDRATAAVWLSTHGVLPPWYADRLAPEPGS